MTNLEQMMMEHLNLSEADFKPTDHNEKLSALMDIISIDKVQSDKLGYDWEVIKVGDIEVQKKYVEQANPVGTADNPIVYVDGIVCINNAYYLIDDVRHVYMDGQFVEF